MRLSSFLAVLVAAAALAPAATDAFYGGEILDIFAHLLSGNPEWSRLFVGKNHSKDDVRRGNNGGFSCATCTVLVGITEQLAQINNETVVDSLKRMCNYLPVKYQVKRRSK